jgi:hypothetical protein
MNHGDKALVNGEPCVRVGLRSTRDYDWNNPCIECPHYASEADGCNSSCGNSYVWVREHVWIAILLETP